MEPGGADRSSRSLRLAGTAGARIAELRERRRLRRRTQAVRLLVGAGIAGAVALGIKTYVDRSAHDEALATVLALTSGGTPADLQAAEDALASIDADAQTLGYRAVLRAHAVLEFGVGLEEADAARRLVEGGPAADLADSMLALYGGDVDAALASFDAVLGLEDEVLLQERAWLSAQLALCRPEPEILATALARIEVALERGPSVALLRARARLMLAMGRFTDALDVLARAREIAPAHLGLSADEAMFNTDDRREAGGVASVTDQLLEMGDAVTPVDRLVAMVTRGVVHVRQGETELGLERMAEAATALPWNHRRERELALHTALEAGAVELATGWIDAFAASKTMSEGDLAIMRTWAVLAGGDVMAALDAAAMLPQAHPRVAYIQALALVEQRRWAEAGPWIERATKVLGPRVELEVASARVELRTGDPAVALRRLTALAEEEPFAPRAWTGLGEAHLAQRSGGGDMIAAKRALQRAVEREPLPAEAMGALAELANRRRASDPEGMRDAEQWLRRAVETNPRLPHHRERLARFLADDARDDKAREVLDALLDTKGISANTLILRAQLAITGEETAIDVQALLDRAAAAGGDAKTIERERARAWMVFGKRSDLDEAQRRLGALVEADPLDIPSRILLAQTWTRMHDRKEAERILRRGFHHVAENEKGRLFQAWAELDARLGKSRVAAGRGRAAWVRLLDEDRPAPELLPFAELVAKLWIRQRNDRIALTTVEQLTTRLPLHARAWTIRARIELAAKQTASARQSIDRALALDPEDAEAHEVDGDWLARHGRKDEARVAHERARELAAKRPTRGVPPSDAP
jgi:tetratricopeptide (TPR) repeat protein